MRNPGCSGPGPKAQALYILLFIIIHYSFISSLFIITKTQVLYFPSSEICPLGLGLGSRLGRYPLGLRLRPR